MAKRVRRFQIKGADHAKKVIRNYGKVVRAIEFVNNHQHKIMSATIQAGLRDLGFRYCFRGFMSYPFDMYVYELNGNHYFSIGMSNVSLAGRGYEIPVKLTKRGLMELS